MSGRSFFVQADGAEVHQVVCLGQQSNQNDTADAEPICDAVSRPAMGFVPIKNVEQQPVLALHRVQQDLTSCRPLSGDRTGPVTQSEKNSTGRNGREPKVNDRIAARPTTAVFWLSPTSTSGRLEALPRTGAAKR